MARAGHGVAPPPPRLPSPQPYSRNPSYHVTQNTTCFYQKRHQKVCRSKNMRLPTSYAPQPAWIRIGRYVFFQLAPRVLQVRFHWPDCLRPFLDVCQVRFQWPDCLRARLDCTAKLDSDVCQVRFHWPELAMASPLLAPPPFFPFVQAIM